MKKKKKKKKKSIILPSVIPVRLPADEELAAAMRALPVMRLARALALWVGDEPIPIADGWQAPETELDAARALGLVAEDGTLTDEITRRVNTRHHRRLRRQQGSGRGRQGGARGSQPDLRGRHVRGDVAVPAPSRLPGACRHRPAPPGQKTAKAARAALHKASSAGDDTPGPGLAARAPVRGSVTRRLVAEAIDRLLDDGPALGRPLADRIAGSRLHNLKELRPGSSGTAEVRILFIFDPARNAVLLVAGDKSCRWDQWYRDAIPAAEAAYEAYLKGRAQR